MKKNDNKEFIICNSKKYKLSACLLIKNETEHLNDWLNHYIKQGVEHFFIASNNSTDGIDTFIENSEYKNMITLIIDNRDLNIYSNSNHHKQILCDNFYNIIKGSTEWCLLVDIDEFMYGKNGFTLSSFIDTIDEDIGCFYVYWNIFKPTLDAENNICDNFSLEKSTKRINLDLITELSFDIKFSSKFGKSIFKTSMLKDDTQLWIHKISTSGKIINNYNTETNYIYDNADVFTWSEENYNKLNIVLNYYPIRNKSDYNKKIKQLENNHRFSFIKGIVEIATLDFKYFIEDTHINNNNNNKKFKIGFYDNRLSERGTTIALYSYANYAEKYFNCESIIFHNKYNHFNDIQVIEKFNNRFKVYSTENFDEINKIILEKNIKYFYNTCGGKSIDTILVKNSINLIHAVFNIEPFGDNAGVSDYLIKKSNYKYVESVPHMVDLPQHNDDLRRELNIPINYFVIGRYGGFEQFDIEIAHQAIIEIVKNNNNLFFIFVNTRHFYDHPRIMYLNKIIDPYLKVKFINTCDCMIHARSDGETFGLAIAEFSTLNKPIITCKSYIDNCHIDILGDNAIIYNSKESLLNILNNIETIRNSKTDWNMYKEYTPLNVMKKFHKVFLNKEDFLLNINHQ